MYIMDLHGLSSATDAAMFDFKWVWSSPNFSKGHHEVQNVKLLNTQVI